MESSNNIYPALPRWIAVVYTLLVAITIPWTVYLALTLPTKQLSRHWDAAWVGLDVAIAFVLILNAIFSYLESKWLVISATATTTLLLTDAWFDVTTAHAGKPFIESLASALLIEFPLAILTFNVALKIMGSRPAEPKKFQ
jgi:hypothetical protein